MLRNIRDTKILVLPNFTNVARTGRIKVTHEQLQQCCLSCSVVPQKNKNLILVKFEIDAINSLGAVIIRLFKI